MGNIAQKLRSLPNSAGVYQYVDSNGRVLYIGKAKNLKNRVKSYFSLSQTLQSNSPIPNPKVSLRIASMLRQVENIEILLVNSEQDALILENSLIKQLKPKYNILLRDDKTYPYIAFDLTKDFPLPCISRAKAKQKGVSYFGPFVSGAREIINSLLEMYPFVQKSSCAREKKSCLFYQIGRCSAPCEGKINKDSYAKIVEEAIILLKSPHKLLARLKEKMLSLSQSQQYEEASIYRDRIKKLQNLQSFSTLDLARDIDVDVLYFYISSNSPAGSHCIDLAVCHEARTRVKLTSCQTAKNSTSTTLRARIVDSSKQADSSENGNSSSLDKNPQDSRGNLTQNDKTNSPSLAEGVRGRVDSNAELSLQDSESECGKTRQSRSFFSNDSKQQKSLASKIKSELKSFFCQFLPAMLGSSTAQIASFIDTILASFLASGSISYLYYANRIFQLPLAIFAIAISTALFPMVAKSIKAKQESQVLQSMKKSFWFLCFMLLACAIGGIMLDKQIIWLLYERGKFVRSDTIECALVFCGYMIGLVPFGLARIFSLYLYATMKQALAAKISAIALGFGVVFSLIFMQFLGAFGLALAGSLSGFVLFGFTIKAFGFAKFWGIIADFKLSALLVGFIGLEVGILWILLEFVQIP